MSNLRTNTKINFKHRVALNTAICRKNSEQSGIHRFSSFRNKKKKRLFLVPHQFHSITLKFFYMIDRCVK